MRILIVDDESALLMTLAANLELEGFEVTEAPDGARALELVQTQPFDLVLSDIRMPGMNGVDLFRAIKRVDPSMPVVMMTAFALESLVEEAMREGAYTVLPKPFDVRHLVAALALAVRRPAVLVVDTADGGADGIAASLESAGLHTEIAATWEGVADSMGSDNVDICVLDVGRFGGSALDLVRRLGAMAPNLPIIMLAGSDAEDILRAVGSTAKCTFVRKPLEACELVEMIARARAVPGHGAHRVARG